MILPPGYEVHVTTGQVYRFGADCPDDILKAQGVYDQVRNWNDRVAQAVKCGVDKDRALTMTDFDLLVAIDAAATQAKAAKSAPAAQAGAAPAGSGS